MSGLQIYQEESATAMTSEAIAEERGASNEVLGVSQSLECDTESGLEKGVYNLEYKSLNEKYARTQSGA